MQLSYCEKQLKEKVPLIATENQRANTVLYGHLIQLGSSAIKKKNMEALKRLQ